MNFLKMKVISNLGLYGLSFVSPHPGAAAWHLLPSILSSSLSMAELSAALDCRQPDNQDKISKETHRHVTSHSAPYLNSEKKRQTVWR
ncbi:unnamed protein product, partial [Gulo gulo]